MPQKARNFFGLVSLALEKRENIVNRIIQYISAPFIYVINVISGEARLRTNGTTRPFTKDDYPTVGGKVMINPMFGRYFNRLLKYTVNKELAVEFLENKSQEIPFTKDNYPIITKAINHYISNPATVNIYNRDFTSSKVGDLRELLFNNVVLRSGIQKALEAGFLAELEPGEKSIFDHDSVDDISIVKHHNDQGINIVCDDEGNILPL
ncbi:MAG TPA: hypothetical protein ENJ08_10555 [Gammaproteobacteria bacterium]|nr:hypothetical protein [Gammaproteobacteria bacterium]